ncbi:ATP-binding protein [Halobacteria archaeon AArc-m2/3/4]|uniref:histidine kinase n=1 Tax=Natronoglomus mannanivorans TaxID=2979990 RepID=A0ABT2QC24_9EURY|nr:ATP-binding protein [Halobacteria archaeon AArc-m2/3/4]
MSVRKFWDIDQPPVVLFVDGGDRCDPLERTLRSETDYRVETVEDGPAGLDRLGRRPAVECLWISVPQSTSKSDSDLDSDPDSNSPALKLVEEAAKEDPATSIVFAPIDGDERIAGRATAAGATDYVPAAASIEARVERIDIAVDRAIDRRHDAEKRSVLETMFSELEVPMYAKDDRARHVLFAETELTTNPEDMFGKTDPEAYHGYHSDHEETYEDDLEIIEEGRRIENRLESSSDDDLWMRTTKVPWIEDGTTRGVVGLTLDVSEYKNRENELIRQIARLQQIPDYVEHDLKNPLSIAQGYFEMARAGDEDALDAVEESLERMAVLLDDFHSLATQELDSTSTRRPLQFTALVEEVWEYVATEKSTLELDVLPETMVVADESQFRPLLKNLMGNAVEHGSTTGRSQSAGPETETETETGNANTAVTVRVGRFEGGFYVADDGPGIPDADRDEIFEQGYTTSSDGTGFGLAIVREAARLHDWEVSVTDSELGGSRFEVSNCMVGTPLDSTPTGRTFELTESVDVGDVAVPGTASGGDGTYHVRGAGDNIWGLVNEFHFFHTLVDGGVRIQGRLTDLERASEWSKAGFMIRSGLEEDAAYGFVGGNVNRDPDVNWRHELGDPGHNHQIEGVRDRHEWFRIDRLGELVSCSISTDGEHWQFVDRRTVALDEQVAVGIAVCSVASDEAVDARFEDVSVVELSE